MDVWRERTLAFTFVMLAASVTLIVPGLLGLGGSGEVLGVLLAIGALLAAVRPAIADLPGVLGRDIGPYAKELWLGPVVGVVMVPLLAPGATAGELQSVGGLAGLVGMLNYFLRPLYFSAYGLVRRFLPDSTD
jgi:hypothetical protein